MGQTESLTELSRPSSLSPQKYGLSYINDSINKYRNLFSSFYHVPHPKFTSEYLFKFVEFANLLVNCAHQAALTVIENLNIGATALFALWDPWAEERAINYADYGRYSPQSFRGAFHDFLNEVIFRDVIEEPSRRSKSLSKDASLESFLPA